METEMERISFYIGVGFTLIFGSAFIWFWFIKRVLKRQAYDNDLVSWFCWVVVVLVLGVFAKMVYVNY